MRPHSGRRSLHIGDGLVPILALVRAGRLVASAMASILAVRHVRTLRGVDAETARRVELLVTAGVEPGSPNRSRLGGHDCMAAPADGVAKEKESRFMACRGWADEALVVRGEFLGRKWRVNSGSLVDRLTVAFDQTCRSRTRGESNRHSGRQGLPPSNYC